MRLHDLSLKGMIGVLREHVETHNRRMDRHITFEHERTIIHAGNTNAYLYSYSYWQTVSC